MYSSDTVSRTVQETEAVENVSSVSNKSDKVSEKINKDNLLSRYLERYRKRWKQCKKEHFKGRKNIGWIVVNVFIALVVKLLMYVMVIFFINLYGGKV